MDRIDLLSVIEHELGHIGGLDDLDSTLDSVMSAKLPTGIRRVIGEAEIDAVFAGRG